MATHEPSNTPGAPAPEGEKAKLPILPLINTVLLLLTLGFFYYYNFIYKRPAITENGERERLIAVYTSPTPLPTPAFLTFEPMTVNIRAVPERPSSADGTFLQIHGKLHFVTITFTLEIRDQRLQSYAERLRPFILDQLVQNLGKKQFHELTTVQGRYILSSEIIDFANHLALTQTATPSKEPLISHVYFTQFIVQ